MMKISTKTRVRTAGVAAIAAAILGPVGVASADVQPDSDAPYARAAARIAANGTIIHSKNVVTVSRPYIGRYCIRVADNINLNNAVAYATSESSYGVAKVTTSPTTDCSNAPNTLTVMSTYEYNNTWADYPFMVTVV